MTGALDVRLLGPLEVRRDGEPLQIAAPKQRALLALLALDVGRVVSADELADRLWGGTPPDSAVTALQVYISQLRKLLGASVIVTRRPGYVLDLAPEAVDTVRFEQLVADGRSLLASGDPDSAEAVLVEALSSWRGGALAEFVYEEWAAVPVRRLEELRLVALEDRIEAQLLLGQGAELTGELEALVGEYPLRERLRGQHMLALYRAGRQADALGAYQEARHALVEELGIDPSTGLVALERRILQQDSSLLPAVAAPGTTASVPLALPSYEEVSAQPVALQCAQCGAAVAPASKFCSECAAPLGRAVERQGQQRKLVTVLFCDMVGSTALGERLDAEVVREVMNRYFDAASAVISRHGGSVEKFIGDAVVAIFGVPVIHEDDALRATRAASEIRTAIGKLGDETDERWGVRLETRIGVNTGEVVVGADSSGRSLATGDTMNLAARLEQAAGAGEILIGDVTWQLVRDAVNVEPVEPLSVKGKAEAVAAHRLLGVTEGATGHARRTDVALVGREREQALLRQYYERWVSDRACGLVTILGTAGVGKSRLVSEFIDGLGDEPRVVAGRCLSYGSGITYWPVAEAIRQLAGIDEDQTPDQVGQRIAEAAAGADNRDLIVSGVKGLMGVEGSSAAADESRWAVSRLFEHVALERPLVIVLDDLQWAEVPLLDLIDHLADAITDSRVLLVCMARPELLDHRAEWAGGKLNATTILLEPLDPEHSDQLVSQLLGGREVPEALRVRVAGAAAGNPLFAEELLAYLNERRHITITDQTVTISSALDDVELPPTIRALIAARLDQLPDQERGLLERGAIEGQVFHAGALTALSERAADQRADLRRLVRKQVLRPDHASLPGEDAYRFRHLLIRDATYEGIPKHQRAEWHEGFARWLERTVGERVSEYEQILAYHYAAAYRYHAELGTGNAEALRDRAAALLARSAERAGTQADVENAIVLLRQLADILPVSHPTRIVALADYANYVIEVDRVDLNDAHRVCLQACAEAQRADRESQIYVRSTQIGIEILLGLSWSEGLAEATGLAREASFAGWDRAAAKAWLTVSDLAISVLQTGRVLVAAELALRHARAAGLPVLEADAIRAHHLGLAVGSVPIDDAIERCNALTESTQSRTLKISKATWIGLLLACRGDVEAAMEHFDEADRLREEIGIKSTPGRWPLGWALRFACLPEQALPYLMADMTQDEASGRFVFVSQDAAQIAHALACLGRDEEALEYAQKAQNWASPDDYVTHVLWRRAVARTCIASAKIEEAERLMHEAVDLTTDSDWADEMGLALIDLAWVSLRIGKTDQARDAAQKAVDLLAHRGAIPMLRRAEALLAEAQPAAR